MSWNRHLELMREYRLADAMGPNSSIWYIGALSSLGELEWPTNPKQATARFQEALQLLQAEIQKRPNKEAYLVASGLLAFCSDPTLRNPKLALEYAKQAERLDPKDTSVRHRLVMSLVANQQDTEALALVEAAANTVVDGWKQEPIKFWLSIAHAKFRSGQVQSARELLQQLSMRIDRDVSMEWEDLQRFDQLRKLILGIEPPARGSPR